jgi:hypothetical protein
MLTLFSPKTEQKFVFLFFCSLEGAGAQKGISLHKIAAEDVCIQRSHLVSEKLGCNEDVDRTGHAAR